MKYLMLLTLFTIAFSASSNAIGPAPKDPLQVCSNMITDSTKLDCLQAIQNAYIDWQAAAACKRIQSGSIKVTCMQSIANRKYRQEEVAFCDGMTGAAETASCLLTAGQSTTQAEGNFRNFVHHTSSSALDALHRGDAATAESLLHQLMR